MTGWLGRTTEVVIRRCDLKCHDCCPASEALSGGRNALPSLFLSRYQTNTVIPSLRTHPLALGTAHPRVAFPAPSTQPRFASPKLHREQRSKSLGIELARGGIGLQTRRQ